MKCNITTETYIRSYHLSLQQEERRAGFRCYDKFGEWKVANPNHPLAKKNYPDDEYLQVISAFKSYFDAAAPVKREFDFD